MPATSRRLEYNCQPRLNWPAGFSRTPKAERQRAAFGRSNPVAAPGSFRGKVSMTIAAAVSRLTEELDRFTKAGRGWRTTEVVITADVPVLARGDFRSQGPEPDDRGAALWFELDGREVVLCCDKWDRVADNITAIAKTLEAMRGLERWGVSETERAFTGFAALPAPGESTSRTWWDILGIDCFDRHTPDSINAAYRRRAMECHPDRGGSSEAMSELNAAREQALATLQ